MTTAVGSASSAVTGRRRRSADLAKPLGESPWRVRDAVRLTVCAGLGLLGLFICWVGGSGTPEFRRQAVWLALGVLVCALSGAAGVGWLLRGLRTVHRERREVYALIARRQESFASESGWDDTDHAWVVGRGMTRYHRPDCAVVSGKPVETVGAAQASQRGLRACGMCSE